MILTTCAYYRVANSGENKRTTDRPKVNQLINELMNSLRRNPPKWQKNDLVSGGHGQDGSAVVDNKLSGSAPHQ